MNILHCTHVKSQLKKSRHLWPVMMDDHAPTHERRKRVTTYKKCVLRKQIVVVEVSGETYSQIM